MKTTPLERPLVIDAILCRLRQDVEFGAVHSIPTNELKLIIAILDAARTCVREWVPTPSDKARGAGTGVGMRAAEDALIAAIRREA